MDGSEPFWRRYSDLILPSLAGFFLLIGWLLDITSIGPSWLYHTCYALGYITGGWELAKDVFRALIRFRFEIDFLMMVAGLGAAALGMYAEGALLFFLFSLGHALEHYAMGRARNAIRALGTITPKTALRIEDGKENNVAVELLQVGDLVRVRPSSRIPVDGMIEEGHSAVDQSAMTGESIPVERSTGQRVFAGTLNGDGALAVRVDRLAADTSMARMIKMVEEARSQQGASQRFAQRFSKIYVPFIIIGTILLIVLPPLFGVLSWSEAFLRGMTVLVGASPCALAISTPSAVLAGIAQAARNGVLIKGGQHLENLGAIKAIALDKTGTITIGRPDVLDIVPFGAESESSLLQIAGALEIQSAHPLAKAITRTVQARELDIPNATDLQTIPGIGIHAELNGSSVTIGGPKLLERLNPNDTEKAQETIATLEAQARTVMVIIQDNSVLGIIGLADSARPNAPKMIARLRKLGVKLIVMLTGDNKQVAKNIADQVGIDVVRAGLMPEDKIKIVNELCAKKKSVAMIGDGVNDAPALAAATVGIAMGAGGTDVALETADVALMGNDLTKLPFAIGLSRRVRKTIAQNFFVSLGVIAGLVPVAALGLTPIWIAVIFHEGSTLIVVLNALRLLAYKDKTQ